MRDGETAQNVLYCEALRHTLGIEVGCDPSSSMFMWSYQRVLAELSEDELRRLHEYQEIQQRPEQENKAFLDSYAPEDF